MKCKEAYDLAFSLGAACACSQALRNAGLQHLSFPFDWVSGSDARARAEQLVGEFSDWIRREDLSRVAPDYKAAAIYHNAVTGIEYSHDFTFQGSLDAEYPAVAARYRRRADRLLKLISESKRVLVMWVDVPSSPAITEADGRYVLATLRRRWPGVVFELLAFTQEDGHPFVQRGDVCADAIRRVTFDYRNPQAGTWFADHELLGRWLKTGYKVRDYRTPDERRIWRRQKLQERQNRYRKFGVRTGLGYFFVRTEYKIYAHLAKRLQRKGII